MDFVSSELSNLSNSTLQKRIKILKDLIKKLNNEVFGHVDPNLKKDESKMVCIDKEVIIDYYHKWR